MQINNKNLKTLNNYFGTHGIGDSTKKKCLKKYGVNLTSKITHVKTGQLNLITRLIGKKKTGFALKLYKSERIKFLIELRSYRGARHNVNLPVRGQRTRTNAKTRRKMFFKKKSPIKRS